MSKDNSVPDMQKRPREAADFMADYWSTYSEKQIVDTYTAGIFLNDALYGIGVAMNNKYVGSDGYELFKKELLEFLGNTTHG